MTEISSVKDQQNVPKLFKAAAKILKLVKQNGSSVKTQVYNKKYKHHNIPALFALVNEANNKWNLLERIIEKTGIFKNNPKLDPWLGRVLMVDIIRGKCCKSECIPVVYVQQYTDAIKEIIAANSDKLQDKLRYIRVNTLKTSVKDTIKWFIEVEGWQFLSKTKTYKDHLRLLQEQLLSKSHVFVQDFHIPEVLVFPSGHGYYFYQLGREDLILQDKASCLDAFLLNPCKDGTVLDMCAAPGMKTSHVAAIMKNRGKIYAVEKNSERFKTLQDMLSQSGATNVTTINKDVSQVGPEMCPGVEYIILDPSCSGSGLSGRKDQIDMARLQKLGGMQFALLRHALTSFPTVKRILYSTCSTHTQENEEVIQSALEKVQHDFELVDLKTQLSGWVNFGSDEFIFGSKCIYACPETDRTTGFFIAVFERNSEKFDRRETNGRLNNSTKKNKTMQNGGIKKLQDTNLELNRPKHGNKRRKKNAVRGGDNYEFKSRTSVETNISIRCENLVDSELCKFKNSDNKLNEKTVKKIKNIKAKIKLNKQSKKEYNVFKVKINN